MMMPRWLSLGNGNTLRTLLAVLLALSLFSIGTMIVNELVIGVKEAPRITVGDKNKVIILLPQAPSDITAREIACQGSVTVIRSSGAPAGYRAIYTDKSGVWYSLVLTLSPQAAPLDQFSIRWEAGSEMGTSFVPTDKTSVDCLLKRAT